MAQRYARLPQGVYYQFTSQFLTDEPLTGVDTTSAARIETLFGELRGEGRTLLVATHDVAQARAWDLVLCLNGRLVAAGAPDDTLTPGVLRATYPPGQ